MSQRLFAATISAAAWLSAMIAPRPAGAHAEPYSYMDLRIEDGRLEGVITAHVTDLAHEIGLADTLPSPTLLVSRIGHCGGAAWLPLSPSSCGASAKREPLQVGLGRLAHSRTDVG